MGHHGLYGADPAFYVVYVDQAAQSRADAVGSIPFCGYDGGAVGCLSHRALLLHAALSRRFAFLPTLL